MFLSRSIHTPEAQGFQWVKQHAEEVLLLLQYIPKQNVFGERVRSSLSNSLLLLKHTRGESFMEGLKQCFIIIKGFKLYKISSQNCCTVYYSKTPSAHVFLKSYLIVISGSTQALAGLHFNIQRLGSFKAIS